MTASFKRFALKLALGFSALAFTAPALKAAELETVPFVDVEQYLGKWFEIASLPQIFQAGCTGVTAEYTLNEDGSVGVLNFCRLFDPERGIPISITGRAVATDATNSKLDVSFFNGTTQGKYWVLELDPNYQWAMVGEPRRNALFILSRQPTLDDVIYAELLDLAVNKHGYDISRLNKTRQ